jgi:hypothetical protein
LVCLIPPGCRSLEVSGFTGTRIAGNGRFRRSDIEILLPANQNCGASTIFVQQVNNGTPAAIITNRNIVSARSDNVFWIVLSNVNDITRLSVLSDLNKVFSGQIIDQRGFPEFHGVLLDSSASKDLYAPELIPSSSTVFAGTDKISVECGSSLFLDSILHYRAACPLATITKLEILGSTSVRVTWNVTTDEVADGQMYLTQVAYTSVSPCAGISSTVGVEGSALSKEVTGLSVGFSYSFTVQIMSTTASACRKSVGNAVPAKLSESTPSAAPVFELAVVDSGSIRISWTAPSCTGRNGDLKTYQIIYRRVPGQARANTSRADAEQTVTFPALSSDTLVYTLRGLEASIAYAFVMVASTAIGPGVRSGALTATTMVGGLSRCQSPFSPDSHQSLRPRRKTSHHQEVLIS